MHVFVTGGAGFIGSHLVEYHLARGDRVHVVDDLSTGSRANLEAFDGNPNFRFTEADILTWPGLDKAAGWADRIYHMAAVVGMFRVLEDPVRVLAINIAGTERVLRAARAGGWHAQVVIASTSEVYGHGSEDGFNEESALLVGVDSAPRWNYAVSKLANESFGLSYAREKAPLPVTVARFFNTIGPRQTGRYGMVVPRFIDQALVNGPLKVFGDGRQTRSFCDVRDTVAALDALASSPSAIGRVVNVGNSQEISIMALAERVRELAQVATSIELVPYQKAYGQPYEDIRRRYASFARLRELTGFTPRWKLDDTLLELIAHRRRHLALAA
jgi:UDP-glucose 4-epimerase